MQSLVQQDIEDLTALQVTKTPTFFVNGRPETEPVAQFYFGADRLSEWAGLRACLCLICSTHNKRLKPPGFA